MRVRIHRMIYTYIVGVYVFVYVYNTLTPVHIQYNIILYTHRGELGGVWPGKRGR